MNSLLSTLTIRTFDGILAVAKHANMIEDYFVNIEDHGLFKWIKLSHEGRTGLEYRLEVAGGLLIQVALNGASKALRSAM